MNWKDISSPMIDITTLTLSRFALLELAPKNPDIPASPRMVPSICGKADSHS